MSGDIKYEYKSVQAVRGMENRSITKAQEEGGWELVDQAQGMLRTTLNFRRARPETSWSKTWKAFRGLAPAKQRALAVAVAVMLPIAAVGIGLAAAQDKGNTNATQSTESAIEPATVNKTPVPLPTPTSPEKTDQVITVENNNDFAAILVSTDYCAPSMEEFATKYKGQKVQFDGSITNMQNHENYRTRYGILIGPRGRRAKDDRGPRVQVREREHVRPQISRQ
ncbi:DUF4839 domain-containing protein [Arthrobacter sp. PAMC25284]|uniref:DUF4839 domain-containing protein n=1 Tax=Arthrobacter sp. PAMC25284 TaxID=2861279 RepID=UPI001C627F37|nr:DUF4839 domain-containing protein [Arthrobacter sp. PAMC25284]QYF88484.1 DUF4839 domain-containing protein [Arthrobacter sp. PAMC25284]